MKEELKELIIKNNNYELLKKTIERFKDDKDYICSLADEFLKNNIDTEEEYELLIIMGKLTNEEKYTLPSFKKLLGDIIVDEKLREELDLSGFTIFTLRHTSNIILDYLARHLINEYIVMNNDIDLTKIDINNLENELLKILYKKDEALGIYVNSRRYLLEKAKGKVLSIKEKESKKDKSITYQKLFQIEDKVHEYYEKYASDSILTETDMLYYVASKLGIKDKLMEYEGLSNFDIDVDYEFIEEEIKNSFRVENDINNITKIINNIVNNEEEYKKILKPKKK